MFSVFDLKKVISSVRVKIPPKREQIEVPNSKSLDHFSLNLLWGPQIYSALTWVTFLRK